MTNLDSILKSRDVTLPTKVLLVKATVFFCSQVWMWDLDYKESWVSKNWCFWTVVLFKSLESPLACKEIQPGYPEGNQSWIFIGRTDAEAETPILWPPDVKNWLTRRISPFCWERLKAGGEGGDRGWDGWMASLTWWTWWTEKPGVLQSMWSHRVKHDWGTELKWTGVAHQAPLSMGFPSQEYWSMLSFPTPWIS